MKRKNGVWFMDTVLSGICSEVMLTNEALL